MLRLVIALFLLTLCNACAISDRPYRQLALNQGLRHDGWIIGIEQARRKAIDGPKIGQHDPVHYRSERLPWIDAEIKELRKKPGYARTDFDEQRIAEQDSVLLRNKIFKKYANDKKIPIVTQVYEAFRPQVIDTDRYVSVDLFNAHDRDGSGVIGKTRFRYDESFTALELFRRRFDVQVRDGKHTHVVLLALGWHVDQVEAVHIYNLLIKNMKEHSQGEFRPLVVGLTWPSAWLQGLIQPLDLLGHVFSYFDKSQDADAIGSTIAAYLLHNILLTDTNPLPVVAIGHSMGARMLSRAYFSGRNLAANQSQRKLDLLICLQGAFSANRFLESDPDEGHPYSDFAAMRAKIVLTSSSFDLANAAARLLTTFPNVGGDYGLNVALDEPKTFRIIDWPETKNLNSLPTSDVVFPPGEKRILMINAEKIVKGGRGGLHGKKVAPHNDYVDTEMGQLLWALINCACDKKSGQPTVHE
ncbi:MAG: hypothetical protein ACI97A_001859 [Planctomycetota bacterium]|jgi:hypothetical protein